MKKKTIFRTLLGFPVGVTIGYLITILISLQMSDGSYFPCVPQLSTAMGSEIKAVLLQAVLSGILGSGFSAASVIWEIDHWGIVKQTGIYFLLISAIMMPIAYFLHWMEHTPKGFLIYFGIFFVIFLVIWLVQYAAAKRNVKKLNEVLRKKENGEKP